MKYFLLVIFLLLSGALYAQDKYANLCYKGDSLFRIGFNKMDTSIIAMALSLYYQCDRSSPIYKGDSELSDKIDKCSEYLKKQRKESYVSKSQTYNSSPKQDYRYMVRDTVFLYKTFTLHDTTVVYKMVEKTKTDTIFITDNSNLIHPYFFIKSWTMEKKTWRWVFNSVGIIVGVGGGLGFGIAADNNYNNHVTNIALTKPIHENYYNNYKLYNGLMWGCIGLGVVALSSNLINSPVKDKVTFKPGIYTDPKSSVSQFTMSVNIKF